MSEMRSSTRRVEGLWSGGLTRSIWHPVHLWQTVRSGDLQRRDATDVASKLSVDEKERSEHFKRWTVVELASVTVLDREGDKKRQVLRESCELRSFCFEVVWGERR